MIVGDSRTGEIKTFNTFYVPLRLYLSAQYGSSPARRGLLVNIVPVDYVADAIVRLTFDPAAEGGPSTSTTPADGLPTAGEVLGFARRWARDRLGVRLPAPVFLPIGARVGAPPRGSSRHTSGSAVGSCEITRTRCSAQRCPTGTGTCRSCWSTRSRGFLHRSDRTVHEQVVFRLASRHFPVGSSTWTRPAGGPCGPRPRFATRSPGRRQRSARWASGAEPRGDRRDERHSLPGR